MYSLRQNVCFHVRQDQTFSILVVFVITKALSIAELFDKDKDGTELALLNQLRITESP